MPLMGTSFAKAQVESSAFLFERIKVTKTVVLLFIVVCTALGGEQTLGCVFSRLLTQRGVLRMISVGREQPLVILFDLHEEKR